MSANSWLWIALIAFLIFCCMPMMFMGRRRKRPDTAAKEEDRNSGK